MITRPLLALLVAATWLAPIALTGVSALHVAVEHAHPSEAAHEHSPMSGTVLAEALVHGHSHDVTAAEHQHLVLPAASAAALAAAAAGAATPGASTLASLPASAPDSGTSGRELSGPSPPRASGPPLLALLSVFRI